MTKKPSEKNKAWEKDRRDRLNKAFDELAKLLPKYDPSVAWSKIEIIQKAIAIITDLQKKQADYLKEKDPELFKAYEEFVNCLKFYQERNAQLAELLKKAKVTLPPVVLPQLLVDKPELLPKEDNATPVCAQKPKEQKKRNRKKKTDPDVGNKKTDESEKEKKELSPKLAEHIVNEVEVAAKPTAVITAFSREIPSEVEAATEPQRPPPKPLLLRLRKPNSIRRLKLIPKPMLRKCYPHPDKLLRWSVDRPPSLQPPPRARRRSKKRKTEPLKLFKGKTIREQSVSPTAAFLLSFPVVTSSMLNGRSVENVESSVSLENLNNFFTTEEYSKFCDQIPVADEKALVPICTPIPVEIAEKPLISGKPITAFTVSVITRPSSPKKTAGRSQQVPIKRISEAPWVVGNKIIRNTPPTPFESCYNFTNTNSMTSSTKQQPLTTHTSSVTHFTSSATEQVPSVKLEPENRIRAVGKPCSTNEFFPRYNHSTASTSAMSTPTLLGSSVKTTNAVLNSFTIQKGPVPTDVPAAQTWPSKLATASSGAAIPTDELSDGFVSKNISPSVSCKLPLKFVPLVTTTDVVTKTSSKPPINAFYSPPKSFFHDFPAQSQANTVPSSADPLISPTTPTKSYSFLSFPSIKTEFPWLLPNTTSFTMSTQTTMTATATTCNVNTNFTPFDLASIVCESLTPTSCTFSLTTPKASEPVVVEAGNKSNKCNQMNLFLPYEETQYMKATDSQVYSSAKAKDISDEIFYDCEQSKPQQKSHVNWMTSPASDYPPAAPAAHPLSTIDFGNQFPAATNFDYNFACRKDSYDDDNQFINWSPTKPINADFSAAYTFENFGSNEAPPNKSVKQIFSVSQMVDQDTAAMKKVKPPVQKTTPVKQTFSNIYSAESLIAKKDNHRLTNATSYCNTDATNTQSDYHNSSNYFYNYPNTQNCLENDYLSASGYSSSVSTVKPTSVLQSTAPVIPAFDPSTASSGSNYFTHTISSNTNDPYDPTYFPSSNYNHPAASTNWNHGPAKGPPVNSYNQSQLSLGGVYATAEPSCQQNSNVSGNLTNFNLSSICPEIDGKNGPNGW